MKYILVPTDFSECAQYATNVAIEIASKLSAEIHFLHIMPNSEVNLHVPHKQHISHSDSNKGHAQNELNELVTQAMHKGVMATPLLVLDNGNEKIENYVTPLHIDFIVMGSHGAKGIRELIIGSNTQRVVRHSPVPVLVIKHLDKIPFKIDNILFAFTNGKDALRAIPVVVSIALIWNAMLHLLFINFKDRIIDQNEMNMFAKDLVNPYPEIKYSCNSIETNDEDSGIQQFVDKIGPDMVAITTFDKIGFFVNHSVAEKLVNHEALPILVVC